MSDTRGIHFYLTSNNQPEPSNQNQPKRRNSMFSHNGTSFELSDTIIDAGTFGKVYETREEKKGTPSPWVVKKVLVSDFDIPRLVAAHRYTPPKDEKLTAEQARSIKKYNEDLYNKAISFTSDRTIKNLKKSMYEVELLQKIYGRDSARLYYNPKDNSARIVMRRLEGLPLHKITFKDDLELVSVWIKALIQVRYLHSLGIAHLDIKVNNFLYDSKTGNVRVCDLGTGRYFGDTQLLTVDFERSSHLHPDYKASFSAQAYHDVYSLGKLFEWMARPKTIKKMFPFFDDVFKNMTSPTIGVQLSLDQAIRESILLYNHYEKDPRKHFKFDTITQYYPKHFTVEQGSTAAVIPEGALLPSKLKAHGLTPLEKLEKKKSESEKASVSSSTAKGSQPADYTMRSPPASPTTHQPKRPGGK